MRAFSELLDSLLFTTSRNGKLRILENYFRNTPDPDRGWALAALTDGLPIRFPVRRIMRELLDPLVDPVLFRLSRDYVGDTAETVALLWPDEARENQIASTHESPRPADDILLRDVVQALGEATPAAMPALLADWLNRLDVSERWALLKLLTGALRVGVSARLAKSALARIGQTETAQIEELWHGLQPPYTSLFAWLEGRGAQPSVAGQPIFRPLMLAQPLEEAERDRLRWSDYIAEWKWDGIRVQIVAQSGANALQGSEQRIYSRTGEDIGTVFPELAGHFPDTVVLDGELLVIREGAVAPFNDLQQRLNRRTVTRAMMQRYPVHVRLYDILIEGDEDLRGLPLSQRRQRLEDWHARHRPERTDISPLVPFRDRSHLEEIWSQTRDTGIEGLMLKQRNSTYVAGRPKGPWFKWKRAPLTTDVVLMYAQRGSGKRSSLFSDYTFGVWRAVEAGETAPDAERELVPVGKAYSGYTDEELGRLDRWIRSNTTERFGPVRAVRPEIVLEVAFDSIHRSKRHKSGVAMRFPRIHRIRWDKPANEADELASLIQLIEE